MRRRGRVLDQAAHDGDLLDDLGECLCQKLTETDQQKRLGRPEINPPEFDRRAYSR
ncbi:MAG: hypothetical protein R3D46_12330 [Defluviimonas denitrificans]